MFIFRNAAVSKKIPWTKYRPFHGGCQNVDDSLRHTRNLVVLQLKKHEGDVLEQDIELCLFCSFAITTAGKMKTFFVNSLYFTILLLVAFLFLLIHKN